MYSKDFTVEIVTPVAKVFEDTVTQVTLPGIEGEMTVLGGHAPLLTMLSSGVTVVAASGGRTVMSTGEGFATIAENKVVCLVDFAIDSSELDFPQLRNELDQVSKELQNSPSDAGLRVRKTILEAKLKAQNYS